MKESPSSNYPKLVFRETFRDEQATRKNSGTPTDVTWSEGKGTFNGTSSKVNYNLGLNGTYSVRIRCNPTSFASYRFLFDIRGTNHDGTGYIYLNITTGIVTKSNGTSYVNGEATTTTIAGVDNEIIVTGITLTKGTGANKTLISSAYDDGGIFLGTIDLVEIYQGTLTPSEVENLYNDRWNKEQSFGGEPQSDVVVNGDMSSSSGWTEGANWEITGNKAVANSATTDLSQAGILTLGKKYRVIYTISDYTSGTVRVETGSGTAGTERNAVGTYIEDLICTTNTTLYLNGVSAFTGSIDNISVQELNPKTLIDFDSTNGVIDLGDLGETSTITDVTVNKQGALFNGTTSLIDTGTDMIGTKAVTIMGWIKAYSAGETAGRIIDNGSTIFFVSTANNRNIGFLSGTSVYTPTDSIEYNKLQFVAVTREADGTANFYIGDKSTAPALSGDADQDSGSPISGTTSVYLGNNAAGTRTFDGLIPQIAVVESILSINDITRYWSESLKNIK